MGDLIYIIFNKKSYLFRILGAGFGLGFLALEVTSEINPSSGYAYPAAFGVGFLLGAIGGILSIVMEVFFKQRNAAPRRKMNPVLKLLLYLVLAPIVLVVGFALIFFGLFVAEYFGYTI